MQTIRERTKEHFPSVLVTLLSIFQALALELLWGRVRESPYLFEGGLGAWLVVFAATYAATMTGTHVLYRRARAEPENAEYFRQLEPATWRDFRAEAGIVAALLAASLVSAGWAGWTLFELFVFVAIGVALLRQLELGRRYWNRMLVPEPSRGCA